MTRSTFFILILIILIIGCSTNDKNDASNELEFNIDSTQISAEIVISELGIKFNPPKNWELIPSDISHQVVNELSAEKKTGESFKYKPVKIFLNKIQHSLLSVGNVEKNDTSGKSSLLSEYEAAIQTSFKPNEYKRGTFIKDGISFTQYLIQKENLVSFKLLFENRSKNLIQFDYATQKNNYAENLGGIESSIGTIQLTK